MLKTEMESWIQSQVAEITTLTSEARDMAAIRPATAKFVALEAETLKLKTRALVQYWVNIGSNLELEAETVAILCLNPANVCVKAQPQPKPESEFDPQFFVETQIPAYLQAQ